MERRQDGRARLVKHGAVRKPLIDKRLRNVLFSASLCAALIAAYYMAVEREAVPADTRLEWRSREQRVEIAADGAMTLTQDGHTRGYRLTAPALRRMLRALHRQGFMELEAARFNRGACLLSLRQSGRKTALIYDCAHVPPQIASAIQAIENAEKSKIILNNTMQ